MVKGIKWLWNDGPMMFVYAVIAYFAFLAFGLNERLPSLQEVKDTASISGTADDPTDPAKAADAQPVDAGALAIEVTSLRGHFEKGALLIDVTLKMKNNTPADVSFRPDALTVVDAAGNVFTPRYGPKAAVTVSARGTQVTPLTFEVPPTTRGPFRLMCAGNEVFSGYSV